MSDVMDRKILLAINGRHRTATVREFGSPDSCFTVLYFHRFGGGSLEFSGPAKQLVAAGCQVCSLELFGHEASEWLDPDEYSPDSDVACARALISEYSDKPLLVIGNGWGGHIALQALGKEPENLIGTLLFDYVNTVQFATDIVMPLEKAINSITAPDITQFEEALSKRARPYGRFGRFIADNALRRVRDLGGVLKVPIDAAAYRPFSTSPDQKFSSGAHLIRLSTPVTIINGRMAEFKNLLHPPRMEVNFPQTFSSYTSPKIGFFTWDSVNAIARIVDFLNMASSAKETKNE